MAATGPFLTADETAGARWGADVEGQLLAIAYQPMPLLMLLTLLVPLLTGSIWWSVLPVTDVLIWFAACLVCIGVSFFLWRGWRRAEHAPGTHRPWQLAYARLSLLAGFCWGLGPGLFIPHTTETPLLSLFVGFVLAVCGVATSTLAAQPRALRLMMVAAFLPPAISAWMTHSAMGRLASLTLLAGYFALTLIARYNTANVLSLVSTQARLRSILNSSLDAIVEVDADGLIHGWSRQAELMFGWSAHEAEGRDFLGTAFGLADAIEARRLMQAGSGELDFARPAQHQEMLAQRRDGSSFPIEVAFAPLKIEGSFLFTVFIADITARKQAEDVIRKQALMDPLTGLPNRRLLDSRLDQALANSLRHGSFGALMYLDLDHFKAINDKLGHEAGDQLLKEVAARMRLSTREGDTVARIGGDEFVVMLENLAAEAPEALAQTRSTGEKLLAELNKPYRLGTHVVSNTPSIGATLFGQQSENAEAVLRRADNALYESKREGRNRLSIVQRPQAPEASGPG